tara:strand:+ start:41 stop:967 length:927 start_codon:yes stop_codon:yes gene_type:complete
MKKILLLFIIFPTLAFAGSDDIKKSGFLKKPISTEVDKLEITEPKNKIIIIFNHGQSSNDSKKKNKCTWIGNVRNMASLIGEKVKGKEIMVYNFCTNHLEGDQMLEKYPLWHKKYVGPYKGKHKLEKRVDANIKLIEQLVSMGVPKKQIIVTGHSCGGLMTLMLFAKHPNAAGGGISFNQACFGKISKKYKAAKVGPEAALESFKKKKPGPSVVRQSQIDEIKSSKNLPLLAFTHPKDSYEGLLSDWLDEIPGLERIIISEDYTINGQKCFKEHANEKEPVKDGHRMDHATCFQYYNPKILDYISSRI